MSPDHMPTEESAGCSLRGAENKWRWRNCRSIALGFEFWVWPWAVGAGREGDVYGGQSYVCIGPLVLSIKYNIGNCSANWPSNLLALSESEAWERASR